MSVKKFKFVSPGIFINEIDNSQLPKQGDDIGPVIIGTALRGPSMVPTRIESFSDFVETFGEPLSGSEGSDVWREGNRLAPTYAAYAAQAYLRNASPITFVRLLGQAHPDGEGKAGWGLDDPSGTVFAESTGAYGLFIANGGTGAVKAQTDIQINGIRDAQAGFTLAFDSDASLGFVAEVTLTETSGQHPAASFTVNNTAGGDDVIEYTHQDGSVTSIRVGDSGDAGLPATGADPTETASNIAAHVNGNTDGLAAVSFGAIVRIYEEARQKTGAAPNHAAQVVGGGAGNFDPPTTGYFEAFDQSFTAFNSPAPANWADESAANALSIAAACDSAGVSPTAVAAGSSETVDRALAAQIAAKTVANFELSVDSVDLTKVIIEAATAGAAGNDADIALGGVGGNIVASSTDLQNGADTNLGDQTGALAAILYAKSGAITLLGAAASDGREYDAVNGWVKSDGANNQFKLRVRNTAANATDDSNMEDIAFNFSDSSRLYIRNVLNTNPTLCNNFIAGADKLKAYFLGETFDQHLAEVQDGLETAKGEQFACLIPLQGGADFQTDSAPALTPWIISQHNGAPSQLDTSGLTPTSAALLESGDVESLGVEKIMRFHSLYTGQWERSNLKIAIEDVKAPTDKFNPYGSFSVVVRKAEDSDAAPVVVERFSSCNLNPASADYVGKKVGDMEMRWDDEERRYISYGQYDNQSRFVRVEVSSSIEDGMADPRLLPFGFLGPRKRKDVVFENGPLLTTLLTGGASGELLHQASQAMKAVGGASQADGLDRLSIGPISGGLATTNDTTTTFKVTLKFPSMSLRASSADSSLSSPRDANFGISVAKKGTSTVFDESYGDLAGFCGHGASANPVELVTGEDQHQFIFTLDDIRYAATAAEGYSGLGDPNDSGNTPPKNYIWEAGSRASAGASGIASLTA